MAAPLDESEHGNRPSPPPVNPGGPGNPPDATRPFNPMPQMSVGEEPDQIPDHEILGHSPPVIEGYRLTRLINRGGQGVVYQAIQISTHRRVAIKVLLENSAGSPTVQRRFEREVDLVAQLRHPHIITVFDSGATADGRLYYVMNYVRGDPITSYVKDHKLDLPAALELFAVTCEAVSHAHQKGVIHRDLKPSNILVDAEGQVHVLDFGLAKAITEPTATLATVSGEVLGTPAYMSPEQVSGSNDSVDTRSDVYSLGVILYEMLTGRFPYPVTGSIVETARHVEQSAPVAPSLAWTGDSGISSKPGQRLRRGRCPLDAEVETIVLKSLAKERERRYQSAGELARDLRNYLAGRPIDARRDSMLYVLKKAMARYRAAALFAVGFVLLLLVSSVVFYLQRQEARVAKRDALTARDRAEIATADARAQATLAEQRLAESLVSGGDALLAPGRGMEARRRYLQAWDVQRKLGKPAFSAITGMLASFQVDPPPLVGNEGSNPGPGGFLGHQGPVLRVAFLPNNRFALSAGRDRTIGLWDVATGRELRRFLGHSAPVHGLAICPGGKQFVSSSLDKSLILWNLDSAVPVRRFEGHRDWALCVIVLPDGATTVSGGKDGTIRFWDLATAKQKYHFDCPDSEVSHLAVSRDGRFLLACSWNDTEKEQKCRIWNLESRREEPPLPLFVAARFRDDSSSMVAGVPFVPRDRIVVWDRVKSQIMQTLGGHTGVITDFQIARNAPVGISCDSDYAVKLWDLKKGNCLRTLTGHSDVVRSVDIAPEGFVAISGALDATLKLWDCRPLAWEVPLWVSPDRPPNVAAFSPDGRLVLTGSASGVARLWDVELGFPIRSFKDEGGPINSVAFSPDGRHLAWGSWEGQIQIADLTAQGDPKCIHSGSAPVYGLAFSADGKSLLASSSAGMPNWYSVDSGARIKSLPGAPVRTTALAISRDHSLAAALCADGHVAVWNLTNSSLLHSFEIGPVPLETSSLALSGNGKFLVVANAQGGLKVIDLDRRQLITGIPTKGIEGVGFACQDRLIVSAGANNELQLWDRDSGLPIRTFKAGTSQLSTMCVSPDQTRILTASQNQYMFLWDLARPARYREFEASLPAARSALDKNPTDPAALATFAKWHLFRGSWWWAAQLFEESRAAGGTVPSLELARCYALLGIFAKARAEYQQALANNEAPPEYLTLCIQTVEAAAIKFSRPNPSTQASPPATVPATPK